MYAVVWEEGTRPRTVSEETVEEAGSYAKWVLTAAAEIDSRAYTLERNADYAFSYTLTLHPFWKTDKKRVIHFDYLNTTDLYELSFDQLEACKAGWRERGMIGWLDAADLCASGSLVAYMLHDGSIMFVPAHPSFKKDGV